MRTVGRLLAASVAGLVLGGSVACGALPSSNYPSADVVGDRIDTADAPPPLDTRAVVVTLTLPPVDAATRSKEWNELFEQSRRAKYDRAVALRDAVARCYEKLGDPKSGGSAKLAQAICSGGVSPKTAPLRARSRARPAVAVAPAVTIAPPPEPPPPFDPAAARAALRSLVLESCAPYAPGAFVDADVTFATTGKVEDVVLSLPSVPSSDERACVGRKTSAIRLPPFEGAAAHVRFTWYRGVAAR